MTTTRAALFLALIVGCAEPEEDDDGERVKLGQGDDDDSAGDDDDDATGGDAILAGAFTWVRVDSVVAANTEGVAITSWDSHAGVNHFVTRAGSPFWTSNYGTNVVWFDGASHMETTNVFPFSGDVGITAMMLGYVQSSQNYSNAELWGVGDVNTGGGQVALRVQSGWEPFVHLGANFYAQSYDQSSVQFFDRIALITVIRPAGSSLQTKVYVDGTEKVLDSISDLNQSLISTSVTIGSVTTPPSYGLAEFAMWSTALNTADREEAECAMAARYGLFLAQTCP